MTVNIGIIIIVEDKRMDVRAKLINKHSVYVVDIEEMKKKEQFRLEQNVSALKDVDKMSASCKKYKKMYDLAIKELEQMSHFVESEMPELEDFDVAAPYYEEIKGVIYQMWEIQHNDAHLISEEIEKAKEELEASDYKVIKCNEADLLKETPPYDIRKLHKERQALRDRINELKNKIVNISPK